MSASLIERLILSSAPTRQERLLAWVLEQCQDNITWYLGRVAEANWKASFARWLALAGLAATVLWLPVLALVGQGRLAGWLHVTDAQVPHLGYALAAGAAAAVVWDKAGGLSKAWFRYARTAMALKAVRDNAVVDFLTAADDAARDRIITETARKLWLLVESETEQWAKDYAADLATLQAELNRAQQQDGQHPGAGK